MSPQRNHHHTKVPPYEILVKNEMSVRVRIFNSVTNELIQEFSSMSKASDFVTTMAERDLNVRFSKKCVLHCIMGEVDGCDVLTILALRVERASKCQFCSAQIFNLVCDECVVTCNVKKGYCEKFRCSACGIRCEDVIFEGGLCGLCE